MRSKKKLLKGSLLCVILDREILGAGAIIGTARKALLAGADMIQLRDKRSRNEEIIKTALALKRLTNRCGAGLIINDRIDVAAAVDSDGVHLGQADISAGSARKVLGREKLIGVSANTLAEAMRAKKEGADYVGAGPVFKTPVKASRKTVGIALLKKIRGLHIPVIAIGGIELKNIRILTRNGFRAVAVIRAVSAAGDPFNATRKLKEALL